MGEFVVVETKWRKKEMITISLDEMLAHPCVIMKLLVYPIDEKVKVVAETIQPVYNIKWFLHENLTQPLLVDVVKQGCRRETHDEEVTRYWLMHHCYSRTHDWICWDKKPDFTLSDEELKKLNAYRFENICPTSFNVRSVS